MQTVRPGSKRLFCKPDKAQTTTTKSGLILSAEAQEQPQTAEVINVGSQVKEYKQRDKIYYKPYSTTDIKVNGEEYFLIDEEDVLATVEEVK